MKTCALICLAIPLLSLTACLEERQDMASVPDRGAHAYNPGRPAVSTSRSTSRQPRATQSQSRTQQVAVGPVQAGREQVVTVKAGEHLYQIAERHGTDLWWLIQRNNIQDPVRVGDKVIVLRRVAMQ